MYFIRKYRFFKFTLILLLPVLLCGCWDYLEVEKRGYVLGISIDKADIGEANLNKFEYFQGETDYPKYTFGIEIPIISRAQVRPTGQAGGNPAAPQRTWNLRVSSNTFFSANRQFSTRLDYPPFYSHIQSIVIGEAVARDGLIGPLDLILRDPEMRRRTKVYIVHGEAFEIFNVSPKIDDYSSTYLKSLTNGSKKTSRILHRTDLGQVARALHGNHAFVLPRVIYSAEEIKNAGCAVFKNGKMLGWLDEVKTTYLKWIADAVLGSDFVITIPSGGTKFINLEVKKVKTRVTPIVENDNISFKLDCSAVVNVAEAMGDIPPNVSEPEFIKTIENLASNHIQHQMKNTIEYIQKNFNADPFRFYICLQTKEPKVWNKVKDNWDDIFTYVKVDVSAQVKVSQMGLIK
jgi:spore germination protein